MLRIDVDGHLILTLGPLTVSIKASSEHSVTNPVEESLAERALYDSVRFYEDVG